MKPLNRETAGKPIIHPERILQFGSGNFLRCFADWMVELLNQQTNFASSIVVVKSSPQSKNQQGIDLLVEQEGLYHVILNGMENGQLTTETKLITSISRLINAHHQFDALLAFAKQPELRFIMSNTTEAGILFDSEANFSDKPPNSFPAKLTLFLYARFKHFSGALNKGCIILPCELIEKNGDTLKRCVLQHAQLWQLEDDFQLWLEEANTFCNTLVDRIVSGFPVERAQQIEKAIGFEDKLLVEGEIYHSWLIEAPYWVKDELPLDKIGLNVKFVSDLTLYRNLKVRILNGAHSSMVPIALLHGLTSVREAIEDPIVGQLIKQLLFNEVLPTLNVPSNEKEKMAHDTIERFQNPFLHHKLIDISLNSTAKFTTRLLPSLLDFVEFHNRLPKRICFAFAALIRFYQGEWQGNDIPLNDDPNTLSWWRSIWENDRSTEERITAVLSNNNIWGQDLTAVPNLTRQLTTYLEAIDQQGIIEAIHDHNLLSE